MRTSNGDNRNECVFCSGSAADVPLLEMCCDGWVSMDVWVCLLASFYAKKPVLGRFVTIFLVSDPILDSENCGSILKTREVRVFHHFTDVFERHVGL